MDNPHGLFSNQCMINSFNLSKIEAPNAVSVWKLSTEKNQVSIDKEKMIDHF